VIRLQTLLHHCFIQWLGSDFLRIGSLTPGLITTGSLITVYRCKPCQQRILEMKEIPRTSTCELLNPITGFVFTNLGDTYTAS